jgi:catechol 2,3-dioxygenase-like lactoylglutathione lyase family enzyme
MSNQGIVSARHVDHFRMTVPDLNEAIRFFEDAIGAKLLWRVGPFAKTPTGFPIEGVILAMLRLGPNLNLELQEFKAEKQRKAMPSNVDLGSAHLAFFVDDINAATQSLTEHGAQLLRGPIQALGEPKRGVVIWYFKTPWGAFIELLWRPEHLPYEHDTANRLFAPKGLLAR